MSGPRTGTSGPPTWDAIVVGGGPGGCVVARRLVESGRRTLLVEAGEGEPRPRSTLGLDTVAAADEPSRLWPEPAVRDRVGGPGRAYRLGRGLGGGSVVNALLVTPGDDRDYERWVERHGCAGWGPDEVRPWLDAVSAAFPSTTPEAGPLSLAFEAAAVAAGHPVGGSSREGDRLGVLRAELAATRSGRVSAVEAYLGPPPEGLEIHTGTAVAGVRFGPTGDVHAVRLAEGSELAAPLVVVAGGAYGSPRLLAASSGSATGGRVRDHPSFVFTLRWRLDRSVSPPAGGRAISRLLRWSSSDDSPGDLQAFVLDRVDDTEEPGVAIGVLVVGLMAVESVGSVVEGAAGTSVVTGALSHPVDRRRLRAGVRHVAELLGREPLASLIEAVSIDDLGTPLERLTAMDDDRLDEWLLGHPGPYSHLAATCPMGPEGSAGAVADHRPERAGACFGHRGLFVADASALPDLIRGGLQLPVLALAERVAAAIVGDGRPQPSAR